MGELDELNRPPSYYNKAGRSRIVRINRDHPYYRTSNKGNISEPRLVMAIHLGRNLTRDDIVYLKDGNTSNTGIDNLILLTRREFATIRDWKRLKNQKARIDSIISIYEERITSSGIDLATLSRNDDAGDRFREVDRDREAYERSRGHGGEVDE